VGAHEDDLTFVWGRIRALVLAKDIRNEVAEQLGLSFAKTRALRRLLHRPLAMRELAEEMSTDKPYATLIVDQLEELGLVTRTISPEDRRRRIVTLTDTGRVIAERADEILNRPPAGLAGLAPGDVAELRRILGTIPPGELG